MSQDFAALYERARLAAKAAVARCQPVPMNVTDGCQTWHVSDGVCGFAWVRLKGNTAFGRWAKKAGHARPGYPSGLEISAFTLAPEINQSLQKGEAAASAAAAVLATAGVEARMGSRID